jgi:hypothetical protein
MPAFVPEAKIPDTNEKSGQRQMLDSLVVSVEKIENLENISNEDEQLSDTIVK